jgi:subtilisin family serine protease
VKRSLIALASAGWLAAGCTATPAARAPLADAGADDAYVLVMAADSAIDRIDLRGARSGPYRQTRRYPGLPADIARAMKSLAEENGLKRVDEWPMLSLGVHCLVFAAPRDADVDAIVARLAADPRVESAQRMNRFELQASGEPTGENDPYRKMQRSLDALEITEAHQWSTGRGVRIAVIDTGVEAGHPDLAGQVAESRDFIGGVPAGDRHGTAVAGIIASQADNQLGIVGIAPGARVLALRACAQSRAAGAGSCSTFDLARAIDYAIGAGAADVINLSLGGPRDRLLERLLEQAIVRKVVVVAAAGEGGASFPGTMDGIIAVGTAESKSLEKALSAPGVDVLSLAPPDGYDFFSGSSIAAAQVSGVVALLLERSPGLRGAEIRDTLVRTARRSATPGDDTRLGVDACAALAAVGAGISCAKSPDAARAADARTAVNPLKPD